MKQRFTTLDIRATVNELDAQLKGKYIQNFYSTQQRFIFVKFSSKDILLIEPGMRLHTTSSHGTEISHFCKKLREYCRHTKAVSVSQHGFDRIVIIDIQRYKIVVELFSAGNIIILDSDDKIIDLHRPVPEIGIKKGEKYIWNNVDIEYTYEKFISSGIQGMLPFEAEFIDKINKGLLDACKPSLPTDESSKEVVERYLGDIKNYVENVGWFGEVVIQRKVPVQFHPFTTKESYYKVLPLKDDTNNITAKLDDLEVVVKAERKIVLLSKEEIDKVVSGLKSCEALQFDSFNSAVDYATSGFVKASKPKVDKNEKIRKAQERYANELTDLAENARGTAEIVQRYEDEVKKVLMVFRSVYDNKMEWSVFDAFYRDEQEKENPISMLIKSYNLASNTATLDLDGNEICLDLSQSYNKNIENYYIRAKKAAEKAIKTEKAMENFAPKEKKDKIHVKLQTRVPYWFERFHFFISSDGVLVIGGKNLQDNELIVKNYMEKNDLYFHCNIHGASSVVSKGRQPNTIEEAGYMALCFSKAWEEKIIAPVFYVDPSQVSKTAPSGEYLPRGSFIVTGKKTFASPHRLEYGVGLLFREEGHQGLGFVSTPTGKEIIHGMPVAAPWSVVKNYSYRVRLCPGNGKKNQVSQEMMNVFVKASVGNPEERIVRGIGVDEYVKVVLGRSRIAKEI